MRFKIQGADADSGKDRVIEIVADSEGDAASSAKEQGVFPYKITELYDPPSVPDVIDVPAPPAYSEADGEEVRCPRCKSTQVSADKRGFGTGAAAAGCLLLGPLGHLAGTAGGNKIKITCLKCGCEFSPGQG